MRVDFAGERDRPVGLKPVSVFDTVINCFDNSVAELQTVRFLQRAVFHDFLQPVDDVADLSGIAQHVYFMCCHYIAPLFIAVFSGIFPAGGLAC